MTTRREMLAGALPAIALTGTAAAALSACSAATQNEPCPASPGGISREEFDRYISLYNAADPAFGEFYAPGVVMETVPPLEGAQAIVDFSTQLRTYLTEHITVEHYVHDANGSAAQFLGEFTCTRDMPITAFSGLFGKAVLEGQILRQRGIILYGVENGKFVFIRAGPPIILQDWS